jgi:predicted transcriptional regulator
MVLEQAKYILRKHNIKVETISFNQHKVKQIGYDYEIMTEGQVINLAIRLQDVHPEWKSNSVI